MKKNLIIWITAAAVLLITHLPASAQTITFDNATTFTNTSSIIDTGMLAYAMSFGGGDSGNVTVTLPSGDKVFFQEDNDDNPNVDTTAYPAITHYSGNLGLGGAGTGFDSTGNTQFNEALTETDYNTDPAKVTLNNLTVGLTYELQVFSSDDRSATPTDHEFGLSNNSISAPSTANRDYAAGSDTTGTGTPIGAMQIGIFVATGTTQSFYIFGDQPNALVLDVIPEPSTYLLMGLGIAGLALVRRFRRSNAAC